MVKIITKEEYEFLKKVIKMQNEQIEELICMVKEAHAINDDIKRSYLELLEIVEDNLVIDTETKEIINHMKSILNEKET